MSYRSIINGQDGEAAIAAAIAALGPLENAQPVPVEIITFYEKRVPGVLIDVWENYGIGDLAQGRLRFCIPGAFNPVVAQLFGNDPYFANQVQVVAYGAFGDLILWHEKYQIVSVNMQLSSVEMPAFFNPALFGPADQVLYERLLQMHPNTMDAYDADGDPMFDRAKDAMGPLAELQIYGMQPPAPFHEAFTLDNHKPVDVTEWLSQKIAASVFTLDDPAGGRFAVRPIGPLQTGEILRQPGEL